MNKSELSSQLAQCASLPGTVADRAVGSLTSVIRDALAARDTVTVAGFKALATRHCPARIGDRLTG